MQYWPDTSGSTIICNQFKVALLMVDEKADYVIRTLRLTKVSVSL